MAELLPGSRWKAIAEAASLWKAGRNPEGIGVLAEYLKRNEGDLLLRYQKWSVEFAERMHGEVLDPVWLKAQEKKERTGG